jgi:hypothetical protein
VLAPSVGGGLPRHRMSAACGRGGSPSRGLRSKSFGTSAAARRAAQKFSTAPLTGSAAVTSSGASTTAPPKAARPRRSARAALSGNPPRTTGQRARRAAETVGAACHSGGYGGHGVRCLQDSARERSGPSGGVRCRGAAAEDRLSAHPSDWRAAGVAVTCRWLATAVVAPW